MVVLGGIRRKAREKGGRDESSDAFRLQKIAVLPASLWVGFFWLASFAALLFGAAILLGLVVEPVGWPGASPR